MTRSEVVHPSKATWGTSSTGAIGFSGFQFLSWFLLHKMPEVANIEINKTCQGYAQRSILKPAVTFYGASVILETASVGSSEGRQ